MKRSTIFAAGIWTLSAQPTRTWTGWSLRSFQVWLRHSATRFDLCFQWSLLDYVRVGCSRTMFYPRGEFLLPPSTMRLWWCIECRHHRVSLHSFYTVVSLMVDVDELKKNVLHSTSFGENKAHFCTCLFEKFFFPPRIQGSKPTWCHIHAFTLCWHHMPLWSPQRRHIMSSFQWQRLPCLFLNLPPWWWSVILAMASTWLAVWCTVETRLCHGTFLLQISSRFHAQV